MSKFLILKVLFMVFFKITFYILYLQLIFLPIWLAVTGIKVIYEKNLKWGENFGKHMLTNKIL